MIRKYLNLGVGELVAALVFAVIAATVIAPRLEHRSNAAAMWSALIPLLVMLVQAGIYWLAARGWVERRPMHSGFAATYRAFRVIDVVLLVAGIVGLVTWWPSSLGAALGMLAVWAFGMLEYAHFALLIAESITAPTPAASREMSVAGRGWPLPFMAAPWSSAEAPAFRFGEGLRYANWVPSLRPSPGDYVEPEVGGYDLSTTSLATLLEDPAALAIISNLMPELPANSMLDMIKMCPLAIVLEMAGGQLDPKTVSELESRLGSL